jgi:hypothetical protein
MPVRQSFVTIILLILTICSGCNYYKDSQMTVVDSEGKTQIITIDENTDLIYMATWCPVSDSFKSFLKDESIRSYMTKRKVIFIFSDEMPSIQKKLKEAGLSDEAVSANINAIKSKSGWKKVYDPDFFKDLPGTYYFIQIYPTEVKAFPSIWSVGENPDYIKWTYSTLGVPENVANPKLREVDLITYK